MRVALVTCADGPDVAEDRDLPVLVRALNDAGAQASAEVWDDGGVDWARFDLAVIRSTWDYSWRAAEFTAWAERCGALTRLANPADVVRWNTDKRYLADLAAAGVPVVETRYLAPGDTVELPTGGGEFVVKLASGAGARFAARYAPDEHDTAVRHVRRLHDDGFTAMVQPYMRAVDSGGERALQFFGGKPLHASRKGPVLAPAPLRPAEDGPPRADPLDPCHRRTRRGGSRVGGRARRARAAVRAGGPGGRRRRAAPRDGAGTGRTEPVPVAAPGSLPTVVERIIEAAGS